MSLLAFIAHRRRGVIVPASQLVIDVQVSGDLRNPTAVYTLVKASPGMEIDGRVVSANGNVNLTALRETAMLDPAIELIFQLKGKVSCDGSDHAIEFRRPARRAFNLRYENGGRVCNDQFHAFFPDRPGRSRLAVLDRNDDGGRYRYCLQIVARGCRNHGKLDPSIINR